VGWLSGPQEEALYLQWYVAFLRSDSGLDFVSKIKAKESRQKQQEIIVNKL
jgi:hypothetical protein